MLQLIFSAFGAKLADSNTGRVIDDEIRLADDIRALDQLFPLIVLQISVPDVL